MGRTKDQVEKQKKEIIQTVVAAMKVLAQHGRV
jgi:hypothetical protein